MAGDLFNEFLVRHLSLHKMLSANTGKNNRGENRRVSSSLFHPATEPTTRAATCSSSLLTVILVVTPVFEE